MNAKLTLTIDKSIIDDAKEYAKENGRSLSKLVENYLYLLSLKSKKNIAKDREDELSPYTKRMMELIKKNPARYTDLDLKEEKLKRLEEKYLK